jgi:hypothetical protein
VVIFVFMTLSMSMISARVGSDIVGAVGLTGEVSGGGEGGGLGFAVGDGGAAVDDDEDRLDRDTRLSRA